MHLNVAATPATPLPPLSLYVHVPWCVRKCPYCDFNSHALNGAAPPEAGYGEALRRDLEHSAAQVSERALHTVFIGGGTPNLLSAATIGALLDDVARLFPLAPDIEITMEANPGAGERQDFSGYRAAGVNRLSLGVQSLDDDALRRLERIHSADDARHAVAAALRVFPQVNLDFMFALPGQTLAALQKALAEAAAFGAAHLSFYQLTLEPHTRFHRAPPDGLPDADTAAVMQECVEAVLADAGHERYEVSAYARPGKRCRHNLNYWRFGDYLGIGVGAHGKLSFADGAAVSRIVRTTRPSAPRRYMELARRLPETASSEGAWETRLLTPDDLGFEFMLNALRLKDGVPRPLFTERTGLPPAAIAGAVRHAVARGLLVADENVFRTTGLGWRFLDDAVQCFLDAS